MQLTLNEVKQMTKNLPDGEYQINRNYQIRRKYRATAPDVITFEKEGINIYMPNGKCNPETVKAQW